MSDVFLRAIDVSKTYTLWRRPSDRLLAPALRTGGRITRWLPSVSQKLASRAATIARPFSALKSLSLEVAPGDSLGIIGRNGSGKSTLLQILAGTLTPTTGTVERPGRLAALLELGSGFNPEFTGRENVLLQGVIYGLTNAEMASHFEEVATFAEIGDFIDQPVKTYSSGMMVRLAFAVQVVLRPDVLIVDEALAVGDVFFQAKCAAYFRERLSEGMSLIFVSHDLVSVKALCRDAIVLHHGEARFHGDSKEAASVYHAIHAQEAKASLQTAPPPPTTEEQTVARTWKPADETGTREAEFVGCEVYDDGGKARRHFGEGEAFRLRLQVRAREAVSALHGAFQVVDRHNRALYGISTVHRESAGLQLAAGDDAVLECEVPGRLGAGEYLVDVALGWGDRGDGAFVHQCHRIGGIVSIAVGRISSRPQFLGPVDLAAKLFWQDSVNP